MENSSLEISLIFFLYMHVTLVTSQVCICTKLYVCIWFIYVDCTINRVSIRARPRSAKRTVIKFSSDNINATYTCSLNGNTFSKCKCSSMIMQVVTNVIKPSALWSQAGMHSVSWDHFHVDMCVCVC